MLTRVMSIYITLVQGCIEIMKEIKEIKEFFGVLIMMENSKYPRIRMYLGRSIRVSLIGGTINLNCHFNLCSNLDVVSQRDLVPENNGRFWKVNPVIEAVRKRYKELLLEEYKSIDEQMIPFTDRMPAKQFSNNNQ